MTIYQIEAMIKKCFVAKDGASEKYMNELYMTLAYSTKKKDEMQVICDFIKDAKSQGNSRTQAVAMVQFRFAKSKRRAYELVKECDCYDK